MAIQFSKNLLIRIVSALALLPPVVGAVYFGGWWFYAFLLIAGALMVLEWNRLISCEYTIMDMAGILVVGMAPIPFLNVIPNLNGGNVIFVALLFILLLLAFLIEFKAIKAATGKASRISILYSLLGICLITAAIVAFAGLRTLDGGQIVMWVFLCVWAMDVGGYFAGKGIGGPKMSPRISPNKTWAGLIGGMALAAIISAIYSVIFGWTSMISLAAAGAAIALIAQMGDLYESAIKRRFDVKDSGELIPGHGGILDRVDGLISAAPVVALYLSISNIVG